MGKRTEYKLEQVAIRMVKEPPFYSDIPIKRAEDAVRVVAEALRDYDREVFGVINMRTDGCPINVNIASMGTINGSVVSSREVLKSTILSNAANVIFFHNHPGGNRQPSVQDVEMTDKMILACSLMDVGVHDHILLFGGNVREYYSFKENGIMMFPEIEYKKDISELDFEQKNFAECSIKYIEHIFKRVEKSTGQEDGKNEQDTDKNEQRQEAEVAEGKEGVWNGPRRQFGHRISVKRKIEENREKVDGGRGKDVIKEKVTDRGGR